MRKILFFCGFVLACGIPVSAQLVRNISLQAGSPEAAAVQEINATTDSAQKLALIDKFQADLGKGDYAILANQLYMDYYIEAKNFAKVAEYAQKQLELDRNNYSAATNLVSAESELHDNAKLLDACERTAAILARYKAAQPPEGADAAQWNARRTQELSDQKDEIQYVAALMRGVVFSATAPAERAALAERFVAAFPDSPDAASTEALAAGAYQQQRDFTKMTAAAQKALTIDPNNADMLILLADYYSEKGEQLDEAEKDAKRAIDVLPNATKPDNVTGAAWQLQVNIKTGLAWSAEGQVLVNRKDYRGAETAFQKAGPLLKGETAAYARNQYRLGYTYALEKKTQEARAALTEAASFNTPYRALAQDTLAKVNAPAKKPQ
jgi:tetratricopeptide (TPR) repeat protein